VLTPFVCAYPCERRSSLHFVPRSRLQYSTSATAISAEPVPKLSPSSGSLPVKRHQSMKSLVPNWFDSIEFHARSSTVGRCAFGPTPSSQLQPAKTLPPG